MKLFMFYIGGDCGNSNVELHDVRFSIGKTAEDCYDDLRGQWWGEPKSLHLDCWGEVNQADGYDVAVSSAGSSDTSDKLFFLNLGGYNPKEFEELHKNILLVAPDARSATSKALARVRGWSLPHRDNIFEVEKAIDVTAYLERYGRTLVLTKATEERPFQFTCNYVPIGKRPS